MADRARESTSRKTFASLWSVDFHQCLSDMTHRLYDILVFVVLPTSREAFAYRTGCAAEFLAEQTAGCW